MSTSDGARPKGLIDDGSKPNPLKDQSVYGANRMTFKTVMIYGIIARLKGVNYA